MKKEKKYSPDGVYTPGQAFCMRCPIVYCYVMEFSNLPVVRNGFEYYESTRYVVQMIEYYESTRYVVQMIESKWKECSISFQLSKTIAYLDSKSTDGGDYIEGATQNAVVVACRVILPDGCGRFDSCDLCYMLHNINVAKIDNVRQAAVGRLSSIQKWGKKSHTVIVVHCYSNRGPGGCG